MYEASNMNFKVSAGDDRRSSVTRLVTLDRVVEWIRAQGLDDYTESGLIEIAARYPTAALPAFRRNFNLMLQRVRAKRKKDQNGEIYEEVATPINENPQVTVEPRSRPEDEPEDEPEFNYSRPALFGDEEYEPIQFEGSDPGEDKPEDTEPEEAEPFDPEPIVE